MKKIIEWLMNLFKSAKKAIEKAKPYAQIAVDAVNNLKSFVEGKEFIFFSDLLPGDIGTELRIKLMKALEKAAPEVLAAAGIIGSNNPIPELIKYLQSKIKSDRGDFYAELAGRLIQHMADGKIDLSEAIDLGQLIYNGITKK